MSAPQLLPNFSQFLVLISAFLQDGEARIIFWLQLFSYHKYHDTGIRTHVSGVAPDWNIWRMLYRLSHRAVALLPNLQKEACWHLEAAWADKLRSLALLRTSRRTSVSRLTPRWWTLTTGLEKVRWSEINKVLQILIMIWQDPKNFSELCESLWTCQAWQLTTN